MGLGNNKDYGNKASNFNWQKRMIQLAGECCIPTLTEDEMNAWADAPFGKLIYNSTNDAMYFYSSSGNWVKLLA